MEAENSSLSEYFGTKQSLGLHLANFHILAAMLFPYCILVWAASSWQRIRKSVKMCGCDLQNLKKKKKEDRQRSYILPNKNWPFLKHFISRVNHCHISYFCFLMSLPHQPKECLVHYWNQALLKITQALVRFQMKWIRDRMLVCVHVWMKGIRMFSLSHFIAIYFIVCVCAHVCFVR